MVEAWLPEGAARETTGLAGAGRRDCARSTCPARTWIPEELRERRTPYHLRLVAEELFLLQVGLELRRNQLAARSTRGLAVRDPAIERAIAELPFELTADQKRVWSEIASDLEPRFHREAQAAANLDHHNVVRAYDVDNDGDIHYMVMEYIQGRDLQQIVKEDGPLDYAMIAEYTRQSAQGVAYAHEKGLIHRDIKPANLLVDQKNVVKLLDLGLARFTGEDRASLTVAYDENVLGTADYLAPEQAIDSHGVDTRADIYSLGCSMYYLFTGHPPFPDGTLPQRLIMHQKEQPTSVLEERPDAPQDLVEICTRMMAKKPKYRYQSAHDVAHALADWMAAHGHASDSGGSGGSSGKMASAAAALRDEAELPTVKRTAKTPRSVGGKRPAGGSGGPTRAKPRGPSKSAKAADTDSNLDRPTTKGPARRATSQRRVGDSDSSAPSAKGGPGAGTGSAKRPSDNSTPVALPVEETGFPVISPVSTGVVRPEKPTASAEEALEAYEAYRKRRQEVPVWYWVVVGGGVLLVVVLLVLLLIFGGGGL